MDNYERSILCDGFSESFYKDGDYIIREGEEGHLFYLIEEGNCKATKLIPDPDNEGAKKEIVVKEYKDNDYFGERALLTKESRAASVIAAGDCKLAEMD